MHPITAIHPAPPITFSFVVVGLFVTLIFISLPFLIFMVILLSLFKIHVRTATALISTSFISRRQN